MLSIRQNGARATPRTHRLGHLEAGLGHGERGRARAGLGLNDLRAAVLDAQRQLVALLVGERDLGRRLRAVQPDTDPREKKRAGPPRKRGGHIRG